MKEPKWQTEKESLKFGEFKSLDTRFEIKLNKKPLDNTRITVRITHDDPTIQDFYCFHEIHYGDKLIVHRQVGNNHYVDINVPAVSEYLEKKGVTDDMEIRIDVVYPVK